MTFFQNLWRDLVDKRLWPVAIVLILAAIAVPFLINTGSSKPTAAAPAATPATAEASTGQVAVAVNTDDKPVTRAGKARDPFRPLVFAKAAKAAASATTAGAAGAAPSSSGTTPGSGGSAPAGSGNASPGSGSTTTTSPQTTKTTWFDYALSLQLKRSGKLTTRRGVRAITYLPSPAYTLLSYLGVKTDGKTATFLVSDGVTVSGADRVCRPSRTNCRLLELKAGDNVLLARTPANGGAIKHYRLMISRIALIEVTPKLPTASTSRAATGLSALHLSPGRQVTGTSRTTG
ncbi:MAG: hypothetical protein JWO02_2397 [Solirubrobacterales bacterium]|nr:hypothetical protein [Solirubrobacterales bacterium]